MEGGASARNSCGRTTPAELIHLGVMLLALVVVIAVFVPFVPAMPAPGLDNSWKWAANVAVAQGLGFGREFIFTAGPYTSILTRSYHPATDPMMMAGGFYLASVYWLCFALLAQGARLPWVTGFVAVFAVVMYAPNPWDLHQRDALLLSLPLLIALQTFKAVEKGGSGLLRGRWRLAAFVMVYSALGLPPLIKGSFIVPSLGTAILGAAYCFLSGQRGLAAICLLVPAVALASFWLAAGQPVAGLPDYFANMAPISSGYMEAMALDGGVGDIAFYLAGGLAVLLATAFQPRARVFLVCSLLLYLFMAFKAGFVRHDGYHAMIAATALVVAALLLPLISPGSRTTVLAVVLAVLCWVSFDAKYVRPGPDWIGAEVASFYANAWQGFRARLSEPAWLARSYAAATARLESMAGFPPLAGTTDIYSHQQSFLLASANRWSPRPVFQSYSAYTPELANINRAHLLGQRAPDNIFFRVEPIDRRLPALGDGPSWPVLLERYRPIGLQNNFLILAKWEAANPGAAPQLLAEGAAGFGEVVNLPDTDGWIYAEIVLDKTPLGRLVEVVYRLNEFEISIELRDGGKRRFRLIPGMARAGFLLSPLVENTAEFAMLYGETARLDAKSVKSLAIAPRGGGRGLWRDLYHFRFSAIAQDAATGRAEMVARVPGDPPGGRGAAGFAPTPEVGHRQGLAVGDAQFDFPDAVSPGQG
jgi:hypothetical protein